VRDQYRDDELIVRRFEQCLSEDVLKDTIVPWLSRCSGRDSWRRGSGSLLAADAAHQGEEDYHHEDYQDRQHDEHAARHLHSAPHAGSALLIIAGCRGGPCATGAIVGLSRPAPSALQ
jgi:hypothetical protein